MPKIRIREVDNSGNGTEYQISNTVYIPLIGNYDDNVPYKDPVLCSTLAELEAVPDIDKNSSLGSQGYAYACYLVDTLQTKVLVQAIKVDIESGGQWLGKVPAEVWSDVLTDKRLYDIRFLTAGVFNVLDENMIKCASKRGDCIALCNIETNKSDTIRTNVEDLKLDNELSYGALFVPSFKAKKNLKYIGGMERIPGAYAYLFSYIRSIQGNPEWLAIAGSERGKVTEIEALDQIYTSGEIEMLQGRAKSGAVDLDDPGDNVGIAINPIAYIRPYGNLIWGNRTLRNNEPDTDGTGILKAQSFLNIRNLASMLKKKLYETSIKYTFEQNSDILYINYESDIRPLLDLMETGNGILGYRIDKQEAKKKARLNAVIKIIPIEPVEDFDLTLEMTDELSIEEE